MRYPAQETAARHQRILQQASKLFRERGIGGVSVPEIMKAAQLTHGPFYNHFASKEALMVGAITLARAVEDKALSDEILARTHADLLRGTGRVRSSGQEPWRRAGGAKRRSPAAPTS
jgi:TetR/AcrR family transcriptional regulator, transcriptional repressor for nem operon